jgi:hypothetical protein
MQDDGELASDGDTRLLEPGALQNPFRLSDFGDRAIHLGIEQLLPVLYSSQRPNQHFVGLRLIGGVNPAGAGC